MGRQLRLGSGVFRGLMTGRPLKSFVIVAALTGLSAAPALMVSAATPGAIENPYLVITHRNAFGIRPPPEPDVSTPPPPPAPPPNVFLTGVVHQRGVKRAFFVINRPGAKTPDYESAVEGDEIQDLKVQEINAKEGKVRVLVSGREVVLNFADNGMKSTAGAVAPPVPGRPGGGAVAQPVAPVPQPQGGGGPVVIGRGGVNRNQDFGAGGNSIPSPVNYAGATGAGADGGGVPMQTPGSTPTVRTLPARALIRGSGATDQVQPIQTPGGAVDAGGSAPIPVPPPSRFGP